jgi:hypothetical protein
LAVAAADAPSSFPAVIFPRQAVTTAMLRHIFYKPIFSLFCLCELVFVHDFAKIERKIPLFSAHIVIATQAGFL